MYNILFLVIVIAFGLYISKNNYKNRANTINSNLIEFADEILEVYASLNEVERNNFKKSLSSKEANFFSNLLEGIYKDSTNINVLQSSMFILEDIMKKIRKQIEK